MLLGFLPRSDATQSPMLLRPPRHSSRIYPSEALPLLDVLLDARLRVDGAVVRQRVVGGVPIPFFLPGGSVDTRKVEITIFVFFFKIKQTL